MAEDVNEKKNPEMDEAEKTSKLPPLPKEEDGGATIIRDANETVMGSSPEMAMLVLGARFIVISNQDNGKEFLITNKEMTAGRGDDCDLRMDYKGVSRRHFKVSFVNGKVMLEDLESKFGTLVKNKKIQGSAELSSGDMIQVGELTLKFLTGEGKKESKPGSKLIWVALFTVLLIGGAGILKLKTGSQTPGMPPAASETAPLAPAATALGNPASSLKAQEAGSPSNIENKIKEAQALAQNNDFANALAIIDKVVEINPSHSQALALQKMWKEKLSLASKLEEAKRFFEAGTLEQAQILTNQVLDGSPENAAAQDLLEKIKKAKESQSIKGVLEEARKLSSEGRFDAARNLLLSVTDPALKPQADALMKEMEAREKTEQLFKDSGALFSSGDLKTSLEKVREGLRQFSQHEGLKQLEMKIESIQKFQEEADKNLRGTMPLQAREPLQKIIELAGDVNPLGIKAKETLAQLDAKAAILGHIAHQEAMGHLADGHFPEALEQMNQLVKDFPQETYFREARDDLALRLDNLGKSLFRAGYVLEDQEPLKAKEIWLRLLNFLPKDHLYAQKIKAKMRNLGLAR